jgi:hypothetical protein
MSEPPGGAPPLIPPVPEWFAPTVSLLNSKVPDIGLCKECHQRMVELIPDIIALRPVFKNPQNPKYLGRALEYPAVITICRNCGHTRMFNTFVLGIDTGTLQAR